MSTFVPGTRVRVVDDSREDINGQTGTVTEAKSPFGDHFIGIEMDEPYIPEDARAFLELIGTQEPGRPDRLFATPEFLEVLEETAA